MYILAILKISINAIRSNKARAFLTTLGIIIGISAVIAMLSVGQGAQSVILEQVQGLGSNTISVVPVANFAGPQSQASFSALLNNKIERKFVQILNNKVKFREVVAVSPEIRANYEVTYRNNADYSSIYGVIEEYFAVRELKITKGRSITAEDDANNRKVAVLGPAVAEKLFNESNPLDQNIKINGTNYKVVGITEEKGGNSDGVVYIPLNTAATSLVGERDYSQVTVKVGDENLVDSVALKIENEIVKYYRVKSIDEANATVFTSKDILSLAQSITGIFTTLLASIAGISLVVGGIGIMNIMLVSVTERTKEIGLRKAVGAKQNAILTQFLLESVVLTLVGGLIGIVVGAGLALLVGQLGNIPVIVSWQSIVLATSVSISIGILFGFYPAYRAAKLNPIDALRYE
jgi:putative ABC transport system permease protein